MKPQKLKLTPEQLQKARNKALRRFAKLKPHIDASKPANHQCTQEEIKKKIDFWSESAGPNTIIVVALKKYLHQVQINAEPVEGLQRLKIMLRQWNVHVPDAIFNKYHDEFFQLFKKLGVNLD